MSEFVKTSDFQEMSTARRVIKSTRFPSTRLMRKRTQPTKKQKVSAPTKATNFKILFKPLECIQDELVTIQDSLDTVLELLEGAIASSHTQGDTDSEGEGDTDTDTQEEVRRKA